MKLLINFLSASVFFMSLNANAVSTISCLSQHKKVADDLTIYDSTIAKMISDFEQMQSDILSKDWVKSKLQNMFDIDQYMRKYTQTPYQQLYSIDETKSLLAGLCIT